MNRAVPASVVLHLLFLLLAVFVGSHVTRQVVPQTRRIAVRMVEMPRTTPPVPVERPVVEPEPEPVVEAPVEQTDPQPQIEPEPVAVPPDTPETAPPEVVPDPEPEPVAETPVEAPAETPAETVETTPAVAEQPAARIGTDDVVPSRFQYYIDLLEQRIDRNWHPKQLGFGQSERTCTIHFHVEQDGRITRETLVSGSGVPLMDRESLKAVRAVGRFLPLPAGLADHSIGVTYIFTLTSGL